MRSPDFLLGSDVARCVATVLFQLDMPRHGTINTMQRAAAVTSGTPVTSLMISPILAISVSASAAKPAASAALRAPGRSFLFFTCARGTVDVHEREGQYLTIVSAMSAVERAILQPEGLPTNTGLQGPPHAYALSGFGDV